MGIEPTYPAWKAGVLPLNYTRMNSQASVNACVYKAFGPRNRLLSAQSRNRTSDTRIFSPLLYQLSYLGIELREMDLNQRPPGYEPDELPTALSRDIWFCEYLVWCR